MFSRLIDSATALSLATGLLFMVGLLHRAGALQFLGLPLAYLDSPDVLIVQGFNVLLGYLPVVAVIGLVVVVLDQRLMRSSWRWVAAYKRARQAEAGEKIGAALLVALVLILPATASLSGRDWILNRLTGDSPTSEVLLASGSTMEGFFFMATDEEIVLITKDEGYGVEVVLLPRTDMQRLTVKVGWSQRIIIR